MYSRIAAFLLVVSAMCLADCRVPDLSDPDEYFDNIGKTDFCQRDDRDSHSMGRSVPARENLGNGISSSNGGNNSEGARAVAYGSQGVFYVAGRTQGSNNDFLVFKYFADGSVDTTFDTDGYVIHSFGNWDDYPHAMQVQTDGKILMAGRSNSASIDTTFDFAVLRMKADGQVDTAFATTGKIVIDITGKTDIARAMVIQRGGEILLAGYGINSNYDFAFARLTSGGQIDTTFNTTGKTTVANGSSDDGALAVAVDSNGSVIGAGNSYNGSNWDVGVVRLLSSGAVDTSFNTSGKLAFPVNNGDDVAYAVAIGTINQITVAGSTVNGGLDMMFARLITNGAFDTTFNTTGKLTRAVLSNDDVANAIAIETSGLSVLGAGYANNASNNDFAVVRIKSNGTLDTSFATSGKFTKAVGSNEDTAQDIRMNGDGIIMVAGRTDTNGSGAYDFAVMRLGSDGSLGMSGNKVLSFGTSGIVSFDYSGTNDWLRESIQDTTGKIFLVGVAVNTQPNNDFLAARMLVNGNLDTTFYTIGKVQTSFTVGSDGADEPQSIVILTDGRYLVGGLPYSGASFQFGFAIYKSDGLDTSFNTKGTKGMGFPNNAGSTGAGPIGAVYLQTDGLITMVGGDAPLLNTVGTDAGFMRFTTLGALDTTFFTTGKRSIDYSGSADKFNWGFLDGSGRAVNVGIETGTNTVLLMRLKSDGNLDTSFATAGKTSIRVFGTDSMAVGQVGLPLVDGTFLVNLSHRQVDTTFSYDVSRFTSDGRVDTSFNTNGRTLVSAPGNLALQPGLRLSVNSKIYTTRGGSTDFGIARVNYNGGLDTTFNTQGWAVMLDFGGNDTQYGDYILDNGWVCAVGQAINTNSAIGCWWQ